jgi:N utilization substance protein B
MEERTSRELAFCYIYSQEIQKQNSRNQVKLFLDCNDIEDIKTREYVKDIAGGIKQNEEEIEKIISENLKKGWTIERISTVDLALLKLAIYEIKYRELPYKIAINEAVKYAKVYGEDTSASFINGVLASVVQEEN